MASAVETPPVNSGPTWEAFLDSAQWRALTAKQRVWVTAYLGSNRDALLATRLAFKCKSARNTRVMSYETRKNPAIVAALDVYSGKPERQIFLDGLKESIRRAVPGSVADIRAQALLAKFSFGVESAEPEAEVDRPAGAPAVESASHKFKVSDIVTQKQKGVTVKFRVTAVDETGKILAADEIE